MRVLICETDPVVLWAVQMTLERSGGFSVTTVADPAQLPPVEGFDVLLTNCQELLNAKIRTVYMSASQHLVDEVAARGIPAWAKNPDRWDELIEVLKTTVR